MAPKIPFKIWFGKHKGKTAEQLMFLNGGYRYLVEWVLGKMTGVEGLKQRVKLLVKVGDNLPIIKKCEICGSPATHLIAHGDDSYGFSFLPACRCDDHLQVESKQRCVPIKFSESLKFKSRTDQFQFINRLRWCCGASKTRMTAKAAFNFFFPEEAEQPKPAKSKKSGQLTLF